MLLPRKRNEDGENGFQRNNSRDNTNMNWKELHSLWSYCKFGVSLSYTQHKNKRYSREHLSQETNEGLTREDQTQSTKRMRRDSTLNKIYIPKWMTKNIRRCCCFTTKWRLQGQRETRWETRQNVIAKSMKEWSFITLGKASSMSQIECRRRRMLY